MNHPNQDLINLVQKHMPSELPKLPETLVYVGTGGQTPVIINKYYSAVSYYTNWEQGCNGDSDELYYAAEKDDRKTLKSIVHYQNTQLLKELEKPIRNPHPKEFKDVFVM